METWIALLRGINVSGQKKMAMADVKTLFESLKLKEVKTYIQSGNVIFRSNGTAARLVNKIEKAILKQFSFDVPVIIRKAGEFQTIVDLNPFTAEKKIITDKLYVTLLGESPAQKNIDITNGYDYTPDRFIIHGNEVYLYCPGGYGNTKINNNFFEQKLKVKATTRNWKSMNELLSIALAGS